MRRLRRGGWAGWGLIAALALLGRPAAQASYGLGRAPVSSVAGPWRWVAALSGQLPNQSARGTPDPVTPSDATGTEGEAKPHAPVPRGRADKDAEVLPHLWDDLGSDDLKRADAALRAMAAKGDEAVEFLKARFSPDPEAVGRLIADLDDDEYLVREAASENLALLIPLVEPALRKALKEKPSPEVRWRIQALLDALKTRGPVLPVAGARRLARAEQVLQRINTEASRDLLTRLAKVRRAWDQAAENMRSRLYNWGEAVRGVQARLVPDKTIWKHGAVPTFTASIRNRGSRTPPEIAANRKRGIDDWIPPELIVAENHGLCELNVDRQTLTRAPSAARVESLPFGPGAVFDGISVALDGGWRDRDGRTPALAPGQHRVRLVFEANPPKGQTGKPVRFVSNEVDIEVRPTKSATLTGRVLSEPGGKGVAGVLVKLWAGGGAIRDRTIRTGRDGTYIFSGVEPNQYEYRLWIEEAPTRKGGEWSDDVRLRVLRGEAVRAANLYLTHPQSVRGVVHDAFSGKPVAGARINFSTAGRNRHAIETDAQGRYRLYVVSRKVALRCLGTHDRYYPAAGGHDRTVNVLAGTHVADVDFKIVGAPAFEGLVVGRDGLPVENAEVHVAVEWSGPPGNAMLSGLRMGGPVGTTFRLRSHERGRFTGHFRRFAGDGSWQETVKVQAIAWLPDRSRGGVAQATTQAPECQIEPLNIVLSETASAIVRLTDSRGGPIAGATLNASAFAPGFDRGHCGQIAELGDGRYRVAGLIPGLDYYFSAKAPAHIFPYDAARATRWVPEPGQVLEVGPLVLSPHGREAVPDLARRLLDPQQAHRWQAARDLGDMSPEAVGAVPALIQALNRDPDPATRNDAAKALGKIGPLARAALPHLIRALKEDRARVRCAAAEALGLIGDPAALLALGAALEDPREEVREAAADAIRRIKQPVQASGATNPASPSGTTTRPAATDLQRPWDHLGSEDREEAGKAVRELAAHGDEAVAFLRKQLEPVLSADPERIKRLIADLDDDEYRVREEASEQLSMLGRLVAPALRNALDGDRSPEVRWRVRALLKPLGRGFALTPETRRLARATWVLKKMGSNSARDLLHRLERTGWHYPRFGIYLVEEHIDIRELEKSDIKGLRIANIPALSEADIVEYDWETHTLTLNPGAEDLLPARASVGVWGLPFVVVADGERCYLGAFWSHDSSYLPTVPICFANGFGSRKDEMKIRWSGRGQDTRGDPRIRKCLEALGKLKKENTLDRPAPKSVSRPSRGM